MLRNVPAVKVTNGRTSVTHTVERISPASIMPRTLCGRPSVGMLTLDGMTPWERVGWTAASAGPCARCATVAARQQ